ncbi:MAG: DUF2785 domain-containing protein [Defluviitaleaceae bacterium]|nr:DUF2785 domain-containing protein [Defluviitaleaceae bacterium]
MRTHDELKQLLTQIKSNNYIIPSEIDINSLISDMLTHIGHTDGELRDKLIYTTFSNIIDDSHLDTTQVKHILTTCIDKHHLFYGIGEKDTDTVFTRAFSSLPISLALWANQNNTPFLTANEINNIKSTVLHYINQEKDCRGYVESKGWAHAIAHIADVLGHLAEASNTVDTGDDFSVGHEGMLEILSAVKQLVCNENSVYTAQEDERLAVPVMDVIYREMLTHEQITGWIDSFNMKDNEWWNGPLPAAYNRYVNSKNFMRSLYFKLVADGDYDEICKHVLELLVESDD